MQFRFPYNIFNIKQIKKNLFPIQSEIDYEKYVKKRICPKTLH